MATDALYSPDRGALAYDYGLPAEPGDARGHCPDGCHTRRGPTPMDATTAARRACEAGAPTDEDERAEHLDAVYRAASEEVTRLGATVALDTYDLRYLLGMVARALAYESEGYAGASGAAGVTLREVRHVLRSRAGLAEVG